MSTKLIYLTVLSTFYLPCGVEDRLLHYGAAFYECLCLPKRYSVLCPVAAFHTAFNDHHSLGYKTFIFSIADEKKEHKSLSTLDKEPHFVLFLFLTFVFSKHTNWCIISNFCPVVSFIADVIAFVCLIHHFQHIGIHRIV